MAKGPDAAEGLISSEKQKRALQREIDLFWKDLDYNNPYQILGVARGQSLEGIKSAYRGLQKKFHPDKFVAFPELVGQATEISQLINEAYDYLSKNLETPNPQQPFRGWPRNFDVKAKGARAQPTGLNRENMGGTPPQSPQPLEKGFLYAEIAVNQLGVDDYIHVLTSSGYRYTFRVITFDRERGAGISCVAGDGALLGKAGWILTKKVAVGSRLSFGGNMTSEILRMMVKNDRAVAEDLIGGGVEGKYNKILKEPLAVEYLYPGDYIHVQILSNSQRVLGVFRQRIYCVFQVYKKNANGVYVRCVSGPEELQSVRGRIRDSYMSTRIPLYIEEEGSVHEFRVGKFGISRSAEQFL